MCRASVYRKKMKMLILHNMGLFNYVSSGSRQHHPTMECQNLRKTRKGFYDAVWYIWRTYLKVVYDDSI